MEPHENDGKAQYGGRDLTGYGGSPPNPMWPNKAKVALNFVINYEEGGEKCLLHGDNESEKLLSDIVGAQAYGRYCSNICGCLNFVAESLIERFSSILTCFSCLLIDRSKRVSAT